MKYLLDTHAWLWLLIEPQRIGEKCRSLVSDSTNEFFISIASAWEIAIKHAAGRLELPDSPLEYIQSRTQTTG